MPRPCSMRCFILITLLLPGCGIITLPVQLFGGAWVNRPWHLQGQLVEENGAPISDAHVKIRKVYYGIDLIAGGTEADHADISSTSEYALNNGRFCFGGVNRLVEMTFSSPHHDDRTLVLDSYGVRWDYGALKWEMGDADPPPRPPFSFTPLTLRLNAATKPSPDPDPADR